MVTCAHIGCKREATPGKKLCWLCWSALQDHGVPCRQCEVTAQEREWPDDGSSLAGQAPNHDAVRRIQEDTALD